MPKKPKGKVPRPAQIQVAVTIEEKQALTEEAFRRSSAGAIVSVSDLVRQVLTDHLFPKLGLTD